jgi:hypothetical protein
MNRRVGPYWRWIVALLALGSWSAPFPLPVAAQAPAQVVMDNQDKIKAKLLYLLPDFMIWDVLDKQKGDVWISVITHGQTRQIFQNEIAKPNMLKTTSGRKIHWVLHETTDALFKDQPDKGDRWHIVFLLRHTDDSTKKDLVALDKHFGTQKGVVFVTEENTQFITEAAINFYEDVTANKIRMQLRYDPLKDRIGVTPRKEMLAVDGVLVYNKKN